MTKHLIIPDPHARPGTDLKRADYLSELIHDEKPDVVICLGDLADMPSLCSYDRGTKAFVGRTYSRDVEAATEFQDRMFARSRRSKKKLPRRVILEGNHEERIRRAINLQPELEGVISTKDLQYDKYFDEFVEYDGATPGLINIDGIYYAHYMVSGVLGRAISGEHLAYTLLTKQFQSCTVGHNHTLDFCVRSKADGSKIMGLCAGHYDDTRHGYAGAANELWWSGVIIKDNVENGVYDLRLISLSALEKEYGTRD